ncbi:hypothetical protein ACFYM0_01095 [Streptomyces sp. NPDC006487]|uniref:hypothetical protein n=1 Tax=Streptomyces sp. NPDC006487 TaxID=3364748 RepID=UPI00368BF61E
MRRAWSVGAMFAGGLAGALLVRTGWSVGWLLLPAAVLVVAVALAYLTQPLMHPGGEASVEGVSRRSGRSGRGRG